MRREARTHQRLRRYATAWITRTAALYKIPIAPANTKSPVSMMIFRISAGGSLRSDYAARICGGRAPTYACRGGPI